MKSFHAGREVDTILVKSVLTCKVQTIHHNCKNEQIGVVQVQPVQCL